MDSCQLFSATASSDNVDSDTLTIAACQAASSINGVVRVCNIPIEPDNERYDLIWHWLRNQVYSSPFDHQGLRTTESMESVKSRRLKPVSPGKKCRKRTHSLTCDKGYLKRGRNSKHRILACYALRYEGCPWNMYQCT